MSDFEKGLIEYLDEPTFLFDLQQGTDKWLNARLGRITGTSIHSLLVNGKTENGLGAGAITEMYRVINELITGELADDFGGNKYTNFGNEYEPEAADEYENKNFVTLKKVGFVSRGKWLGCSPDRLIPEMLKGVEIKCKPKEHARIFDVNQYDEKDYIQAQYCMWITGYTSWDLIYFNPFYPEKSRLVEFNLTPDDALHLRFQAKTKAFINEVETKLEKYK